HGGTAAGRRGRRDRSPVRRGGAAGGQGEDGVDLVSPAPHGRRLLARREADRHDVSRRAPRAAAGIQAPRGARVRGLLRGRGPAAALMRPVLWSPLALLAAPAVAWWIYKLAKGLGFLDPPADEQHELRRTILAALYAFLLFLPILIFGFGRGWPRAWIFFGIMNALALASFSYAGIRAAVRAGLGRLRFPPVVLPSPDSRPPDVPPVDLETHRAESD